MTECSRCPVGHFTPEETTVTLEDGETTLVVKHVPADVCDTCGEAAVDVGVADQLGEMLDAAVRAGVETAVRPYTPEALA